jgi:phosphoglycerol transferase MdoB-like AlkP superfamily enzyme
MPYLMLYLLLLALSSLSRLGVYLYNQEQFNASLGVILRTFALGARYDSLVIASALLILLVVHVIGEKVIGKALAQTLVFLLTLALVPSYLFLLSTEAPYFRFFQTKLNLWTLIAAQDQDIMPVVQTAWGMNAFKPFILAQFAGLSLIAFALFSVNLRSLFATKKSSRWFRLQFLPLLALSFVYWPDPLWRHVWAEDQTTQLNQLGLNTVYGVTVSAWQNHKTRSINTFVADDQLQAEYDKIYRKDEKPSSDVISSISKGMPSPPNVVFIVMEYMGARYLDAWTPYGPKVAPFMSELAKDSLMFDHIYSAAMRTQHGYVSSVSSFPSILTLSIDRNRMGNKIPTLASFLPEYKSTFLCGGEANFDNMDAFALQGDFQAVLDHKQFQHEKAYFKEKLVWGYPDGEVYDYLNASLREESKAGQPLLKFIVTTTAHEPFDLPSDFDLKSRGIDPGTPESGIAYADYALEQFFNKAKQEAYYQNTIFVMIADHSRVFTEPDMEIKKFHIPLLIHSPLLKELNGRYSTVGGHIDVIPTLLALMGRGAGPQPAFGHNLLDNATSKVAFSRDAENLYMIEGQKALVWNTKSGQADMLLLDEYSRTIGTSPKVVFDDADRKRMLHSSQVFLQAVGKRLNTGLLSQGISHH